MNAKHQTWFSRTSNTAGRVLLSHMSQNNYIITVSTTPTNHSDPQTRWSWHNFNKKLNSMRSIMSTIFLLIITRSNVMLHRKFIYTSLWPAAKKITNWKNFVVDLYNNITNRNSKIASTYSWTKNSSWPSNINYSSKSI